MLLYRWQLTTKPVLGVSLIILSLVAMSNETLHARKGGPRKPEVGVDLKTCLEKMVFYPSGFDFDKNGDCWVIDGLDGGQIIRCRDGKIVQTFENVSRLAGPLACVEDAVWFYGDGMLHKMDAKTGKMLKHVDTRYKRAYAGMAYDGKHVWFFANGQITLHDTNDGKVVRTITPPFTLHHAPLAFDGKNMWLYDACAERFCKLDDKGKVLQEDVLSKSRGFRTRSINCMAFKKEVLHAIYSSSGMRDDLIELSHSRQDKILERIPVRLNGNKPGTFTLLNTSRGNSYYSFASTDGIYMIKPGSCLGRYYDTFKTDDNGMVWMTRAYLYLTRNIEKDMKDFQFSAHNNVTASVKVEKKTQKGDCDMKFSLAFSDSDGNRLSVRCEEECKDPEYCPKLVVSDADGKVLHEDVFTMG